jgi:1-acyl-sn-glycerol-3-phosphate acyltransferase
MFNHESMFDVFMLGGSIPYYVNAIGWEGIFKWPLFGFFVKRYGAYAITHDNTDKARETLKAAEKILVEDGDSMLFSPEGQRTLTGEMGEFKKGGFHFVKSTNVASIVPVGLIGAYRANVRNSWIVNPGKLTTVFGEPITPAEYKDLSVEELRDLTKSRVANLLV